MFLEAKAFNMSPERLGIAAILALAAMIALYYATSSSEGATIPVPEAQTEAQFFGVSVGGSVKGKTENNLLMPEVHFWAPGWPSGNTGEPVITTRHRYPVVSGANISSVIHMGWNGFSSRTPANDDWRLNPPEVAIL